MGGGGGWCRTWLAVFGMFGVSGLLVEVGWGWCFAIGNRREIGKVRMV